MKKLVVSLIIIFQIVAVSCFSACGNKGNTPNNNTAKLQTIETYSDDIIDKYLNPMWQTTEMYDEGGVIVGETGEIQLLRKPVKNSITVRSVHFEETYQEGVDYIVDGNKIRRVATGNLPYFRYDEYYFDEPYNGAQVICDPDNAEIDYEGIKYLYYSEGSLGVKNYLMITYRTNDPYTQFIPRGDDHAQSFINKLKTDENATIMFYGDSITAGCCASSTSFGGNENPYLPRWCELVCTWLTKNYKADVKMINKGEGGKTTQWGLEHFDDDGSDPQNPERVGPYLNEIDLMLIAFGANDPQISDDDYKNQIKGMVDKYLDAQPTGSIILVSPFVFNQQTSNWFINQYRFEGLLEDIKAEYAENGKSANISVAKVYSFSNGICNTGKRNRDYLGNNLNHPNDFGVRMYAQVILKTLCGDEFFPVNN